MSKKYIASGVFNFEVKETEYYVMNYMRCCLISLLYHIIMHIVDRPINDANIPS